MYKLQQHHVAGILICLIGMLVIAGWLTHQQMLVTILPGNFAMVFNVAVCFVVAGVALLLPESRQEFRKKAQQTAGMSMMVLAGLTVLQYPLDIDLGIDQLLVRQWFEDGNPHPGRMAPLASVGFMLTGACFLLMHRLRTSKAAQFAMQVLTYLILAVGIFSLISYTLKLELLYAWYRLPSMAPQAAIAFILLGGSLWISWFQTLRQSGAYDKREDKRIATKASIILFLLTLTGGMTGFVLSMQRTEEALKQSLEAALANRTQFLEFVIGDGVKFAKALATDPSLLAALHYLDANGSADWFQTLSKLEEHLFADVFSGMAVLSAHDEIMWKGGRLESPPPMTLRLGQDAVLLWNRRTILQVSVPIVRDGRHLGTLVTQREVPAIDKLLADARLLGQTGDIAICSGLSGDQLRCMPTHLMPQGRLHINRLVDGKPWPASLALAGKSGVMAVRDSRGQQVIAAYGPVTGLGLGVVVKQDTVELYAPIRAQLTNLFILLTLLLAASLALLRSQLLPLVTSLLHAKRDADLNEAKIRSVVDNIADGVITIDEQGTIESVNPAAAAMFGYSQQEAAGKNVDMLIPPHFMRAHAEGMAPGTRTGEARMLGQAGVEVQGLRKDGSEFPMQISMREMLVDGKRMFVGITRDISRRRRNEEGMRKAQERFHLVSQATNDVIWDVDFSTRNTWWNEALTREFGYPTEQVTEGPDWWRERIHPNDRAEVLGKIEDEIRQGGQTWVAGYRFAKADGSYIHIHDRGYIQRDSDGNPTRMIGAMMDVTERKLAEDRLRRSETRFSNVFNLSPIAISISRIADGRMLDVNDAMLQMLGYQREEVIGKSSLALDFWFTPEQRQALVERIKREGTVRDSEMPGRTRDGSILDLLISVDLVELNGEQYLFCFLTNVTERKRAEKALRESEEKYRSIVETTKDWIWSIDAQGRVLYANPAVEDILGYRPDELLGTNILTCMHPADAQELARSLAALSAEKGAWNNMVVRWRHKDGSDRYTQSCALPMLGDRGELLGYRGSDHDITLLKRYEQELQEAKDKAESANQAKSEFLANMSHEIRTPMNGVIGLTNLVLKTPLSAQQYEYLGLIKSSADSLLRLLNDILDFSKMEARKLELDIIEFDLRESIGDTLKAFAASASERGLELTSYVAPDVPPLLLGDPGRLAQIIVNLTGNALKFTRRGEVVVRVALASQSDSSALLKISVSDTGIGMSAEQQTNIFAAFAQADSSTTRHYGGTGLGLSIVAQLVALMNGSIGVESELGKGTTFHLTVQLGLPEHQPVTPILQQRPAVKNMPVLVVDDNRTNRLILGEILISWGMRPVLAADGRHALEEMQQQAALGTPFALVLLDSQMPHFDGFQVAEAIKSFPALNSATIMMLSSSDMSGEIARCNALGVSRFLRKPVKQSELFDAIVTATNIVPPDRSCAISDARPLPAKPLRRLNVLVAEDHPINQRLVTEILRERGHFFSIAANGMEVLQMLYHPPADQQPFDVILMDGQMPEMDGYQATAEIRRRERSTGKHICIIAVTANAMKDDRESCLAAGMDDYVTKPIDPDQLLERLEAPLWRAIDRGSATSTAEVAATAAQAAFDYENALKRARGKLTLLKQLAQLFLQDLPGALSDIRSALAAGDARAIERSAHRLRGAAFTVSAAPLAEAADRLEQIGRNREFDRMREAAGELEARASELVNALEAFTGSHN